MKSEGFGILATKKMSLALHIYWKTTPKDGRKNDFWFVERRVCVSSVMAATPLSFILLYSLSLSLCSFSLQMMPLFIGFNGSSSCTYQQWWLSFVNGWCSFFWQYSAATNNPPLYGKIQISSLKNHISLIWNLFLLKFGPLIGL